MGDIILAADPGGTTGYALYWPETRAFLAGHCDNWIDFHWMVEEWQPNVVIVEKFTITMQTVKKTRQYDALWLTGALMVYCDRFRATAAFQTPADAKSFVNDGKLKHLGWYSSNDHSRDATRHLVLWLFRNGYLEAKDLISG